MDGPPTCPPGALPGFEYCVAEGSAAIAPIKTVLAFFVSRLVQRIEPFDIVDRVSYASRELGHRFKAQIVQARGQRQAGNAASYRGNRHAIEDIVERLELKPAAGPLGDDADSDVAKNRLQILDETQEAGRVKMVFDLQVIGDIADHP